MEAKLKEYRALKRRQALIEKGKEFLTLIKRKMSKEKPHEKLIEIESEEEPLIEEDKSCIEEDLITLEEDNLPPEPYEEEPLKIKQWIIVFLIWLIFFIVFIKLEFGAVYFVLTLLVGICLNTRTRPRRRGEKSAYSVFNRNCERIDGSLKPEQLQRQYMFGGIGLF